MSSLQSQLIAESRRLRQMAENTERRINTTISESLRVDKMPVLKNNETSGRPKQSQILSNVNFSSTHLQNTPKRTSQLRLNDLQSSHSETLQTVQVENDTLPRIDFHKILSNLSVDIKTDICTVGFIKTIASEDQLMVGVCLTLLFNYYKSKKNGVSASDFVRLCRAAGFLDGNHSFSNPDIFTIATSVIDTMNDENAARLPESVMDFQYFCVALADLATYRYSQISACEIRHYRILSTYLIPLTYKVMLSDLVPFAIVKLLSQKTQTNSQDDNQGNTSETSVPGIIGPSKGTFDKLVGFPDDPYSSLRLNIEVH